MGCGLRHESRGALILNHLQGAKDIGTSHLISVVSSSSPKHAVVAEKFFTMLHCFGVPVGCALEKQTLLCKVNVLTSLRIEVRQNLNCLRQVRLNVLHILDGLFVCRRFLMAYGGCIEYFLSRSGQTGRSFPFSFTSTLPVQCPTKPCVRPRRMPPPPGE